jgi:serine/threonine-protein kinase RsbW
MGSTPQPGAKDRAASAPLGLRFSVDDLRRVRRVTAEWADRAALPPERADDFVIAVNEIATNAVRYGSPTARLLLRVAGENMAEAEVRDEGRWLPGTEAVPAGAGRGGMGLPLVRRACDAVEIRTGDNGTTVLLRMRPQARGRIGGPR